ncbi:MAG: chromosome segregation protein SMC, partial [Eubacteriales bacterium]
MARFNLLYLKSLEIQGFKSFPDKTVVHFGNEITSIVGPNGSGKSNISDAISWVMGEQSAKALRGGKMEDVIFGGTLKRSQVGFAEASLVLDNQDGSLPMDNHEVMVTRRYYRSGDSEYYINKQTARLRDIHELFMDTGLGREGYSNIGQGRIDEILAVKSGDRRQVFEEAAGISKYRHRKEETQRRLLTTEDNLLRIGDKISELELQLEPLKAQAEKANKYLELGATLKGLEVTVWLDSLRRLAEVAKKATEDFTSAQFILSQEQENLDKLYQQNQQYSDELRQRDVNLDTIRQDIATAEGLLAQQEGDLAVLVSNLENAQENLNRVTHELAEQHGRTTSMAEQIAQKHQRIAQLEGDNQDYTPKLSALETALADLQTTMEQLSKSKGDTQHQLAVVETQRQNQEETLHNLSRSMTVYEAQKKTLEDGLSHGREQLQQEKENQHQCEIQLQAAKDLVASEKNALAGYEMRYNSRVRARGEVAGRLQTLSIALDTTLSRKKMLQEMERDFEGYSKSVRMVMQEKNRGGLAGVLMPVSQALRAHEDLSVAVETALGAAMQHILVEHEQAGKAAIQMLKRRDGGRATFLPISTIRGRTLQEQGLEHCVGFVGIGSDMVSYDPIFQGVFENLLGRTVFVETLDNGIAMAKKYNNRFRIVTLDGQVLNAGGSMTGGSASRSAGILSRANERERLEKLAQSQSAEKEQLKQESTARNQAVAEVEFQRDTASRQLRQGEDEVLRLDGQLQQSVLLVDNAVKQVSQAEGLLENFAASSAQSADLEQQLKNQLVELLEQDRFLHTEMETIDQKINGLEGEITEISQQIAILTAENASAQGELRAAQASVAELQSLQQVMEGDRSQKSQWVEQYQSEIGTIQTALVDGEAEKTQKAATVEMEKAKLQQALTDRATMEAQKTKNEKATQDKNKDILLMERECARLEQKKTTASLEEAQIIDKLWDSYELTPSTAADHVVEVEGIAAASREIQTLKRKISLLGTPNLGAIEEFARVSERFEYLTTQRDDVLFAKNELENIIQSITAEMTEIFVREFRKINEYFGKTFVEMFGGGKGSLEL